MKRLITALFTTLLICIFMSSCTVNNDFEEITIEEVSAEEGEGTTGNNGSSVGQGKPPWPS